MRILHLTLKENDVRAQKAARAAAEAGHTVGLIMGEITDPRDVTLVAGGEWKGIGRWLVNRRAGRNQVRHAIGQFQADVVHVHELDALWILVARWTAETFGRLREGCPVRTSGVEVAPFEVPVVYDQHEWEPDRPYPWPNPDERADRAWREEQAVRGTQPEMVCVSPALQSLAADRYGIEPSLVVNAPPAPTRLHLEREGVRAMLGLEAQHRAVVFCGNPTPDRRPEHLAQAMRELHPHGFRLFMLGQRADRMVKECIDAVPDVQWLPPAPYPWPDVEGLTMLDWLSAADVGFNGGDFQYTNWSHGLPNKVFEYGFAGVPVVSAPMLDVHGLNAQYDLGVCYSQTVASLVAALQVAATRETPVERERLIEDWAFDNQGWPVLEQVYARAVARRAA